MMETVPIPGTDLHRIRLWSADALTPTEQAALLASNLPTVEEELQFGAAVSISRIRLLVRRVPLREWVWRGRYQPRSAKSFIRFRFGLWVTRRPSTYGANSDSRSAAFISRATRSSSATASA
jgi:hypothetical protein